MIKVAMTSLESAERFASELRSRECGFTKDAKVLGGPVELLGATLWHVGYAENLVVSTVERNGYHDSEFCAVVFDPDTKKFHTVPYASTAYWSYGNSAEIDAPAFMRKHYREWHS